MPIPGRSWVTRLPITLDAATVAEALKMAIKNRSYNNEDLVHHSDRGLQYCSKEYVGLAQSAAITMSMTEQGDPYENALAEVITSAGQALKL